MKNRVVTGLFLVVFSILLAIGLPVVPTFATDRSQDNPQSLMQQKLVNAQKLLEALVMEDFDAIAERAKALHQISIEAGWSGTPSKDYGLHADAFRKAAANVETKAIEHDLDGVAWNYMRMVVTCVDCHQALRGTRATEVTMLMDLTGLYDADPRSSSQN